MAMVDAADDESKATIYSVSVLLKMVDNAATQGGREENDKIADKIFGPESGDAATSPSPADPIVSNPAQEQDRDWRAGLTLDERIARLGELLGALETEEAQQNLEDAQSDAESESAATEDDATAVVPEQPVAPVGTVTDDQSSISSTQPPVFPAVPRPSMTLRDLASLVKQLLEASASRFDQSSICCILEFSKAVEIFGQDRFMREPGQSRDVLRPGTIVFKYAQRAGLPAGIFRWLQGIPDLPTEFKYPAATIVETARQLTARGK